MGKKREISSTVEASLPLLESHDDDEESEAKWRWWNRVLDIKEAKNQIMLSLPIIMTNVSFYSIFLVSVMFAGHLGELQLAGVARGCGWQHIVVCINLASYYLIGMPISLLLGLKLGLREKGLWVGLICGLTTQACCLLVLAYRNKWARLDLLTNGSLKE